MITTENNTFYAEFTIGELMKNNKQLLDTQIETSTIMGLVDLCLRQQKHQRFLDLLMHLCSCNDEAIVSNQDGIYSAMLERPDNMRGMLCHMHTENNTHFVSILDNGCPE